MTLREAPGWAIGPACEQAIHDRLREGDHVLELGSGPGTARLRGRYRVTSVEHDAVWLDRYGSHYIHAPIVRGWYDVGVLRKQLPLVGEYDLLLVDGPPGDIGRRGLLDHLDLFDLSVHIIIDDVNRPDERALMERLVQVLGREATVHDDSYGRQFAVIDALYHDGRETTLINATPAALELAAEHGIDLTEVDGSGAGGRILKSDVAQVLE